jgi:hypothetical protein
MASQPTLANGSLQVIQAKLEVDRAALVSAFRVLEPDPASVLAGQQAVFDFRDGVLEVTVGEVAAGVEAVGTWPGRARLKGEKFPNLAKVIPAGDRVTLVVDGGKLRMGTFAIGCHWETGPEATAITVPIDNPSLLALLQLNVRYSEEAVRAAGLSGPVAKARQSLCEAIEGAAEQLTPFEVEPARLEDWVMAHLRLEEPKDSYMGKTQHDLGLRPKGEQMLLGDE